MAGRRARGLLDAEMDDGDTLALSHSLNTMATRTEGEEDIEDEEEEEEEEEENDGSGDEEEKGDEEDVQRNKENHPTENVSGTARVNYSLAFKYLEETYTSAQTLFEMKPDFDLRGCKWALQPTQQGLFFYRYLTRACKYEPVGLCIWVAKTTRVEDGQEVHVTNLWTERKKVIARYVLQKRDYVWDAFQDPNGVLHHKLRTAPDEVFCNTLGTYVAFYYTTFMTNRQISGGVQSSPLPAVSGGGVFHPSTQMGVPRNVPHPVGNVFLSSSQMPGSGLAPVQQTPAVSQAKIKAVKMKKGVGGKQARSLEVAESSASDSEVGKGKKGEAGKGKKGGRPEKRNTKNVSQERLALMTLNPLMNVSEKNEIVSESANMPYKPLLGMTGLNDALVIPVLTEVKSGVLSLDEMNNKFTLLKIRQRTVIAFVEGVGADSWEAAKEEFPVHTQEAMLSQYYGLYERNVKETPIAMQLYIAKVLNYKDKLRLSQQEEQTAAIQDPEGLLTNWTAFEGEGYRGTVKVAHCDMLQLPEKVQDRLPFTLCIMDFPCGYNAEDSMDDEEPFGKPQIEGSIASFKKITCAPYWVMAGFCSSNMLTDVKFAFSSACNCGVEVGIWVAPNVSTSAGVKLTNCWQHCVIGFHSESGCREPIQFQFIDSDTRMTCWNHNAVVRKYTFAADNEILCPYQKPISLYEWLIKKFFEPNDSYIVDAFSGSGTGAIATLLSKRHVLVVENDLRCVRGIRARLAGRDFVESAAKEIDTRGRTVAEGWRHA
ncbi:hypothetical protein CBR_g52430 [Chara braunii]|uniref:DNA methylase N-4/N-6 domain-containing protein n=1 Tax=Chara braunii TaxID=69332 RepID=A0A388MA78_CHABU|nr:hypothetical protein CBR_g52430 [Chara braunii]|eukprot:GBG91474.1 hypothetical protein CBR_g52430 [Chara braunii]